MLRMVSTCSILIAVAALLTGCSVEASGEDPLYRVAVSGQLNRSPQTGDKVPVFEANEVSTDSRISVSYGTTEQTLVLFVAHWCPVCNHELAALATAPPSTEPEVLVVSTFVRAQRSNFPVAAWIAGLEYERHVVRDSASEEIAAAFNVDAVPAWFLVDANGELVATGHGAYEPEGSS